MTKKNSNSSNQPSLFEWVKKAQALSSQSSSPPHGSLDIDSELRAAVTGDIKASPLSRYQIAARMSELVGQEITESMLYNWTAESHDKHNMPCKLLPAFVVATGGRRVFECLSRRSGLFALPGAEALGAEIHQLREKKKKIDEEIRRRTLYLKEINAEKRG